ncbi:MAG TPA: LemA family protein [Candidatus Hydrogenedentes bacterium]|nr:LemA family protein [Candidatus Hydrogenedentota bacterium]HQH51655.1 LemA family protein [Candidatus Hydrogenedentota bacterium]HQM50455.1 LemA family protein [Candidatus Hydrogenedentota bacterium]
MSVAMVFVVLAVIVLGGLGWLVGIYNGLVRLRNEVKNAWAQVDVQLKRRYDLIPNLLETVKGYAKHERETFEKITQARSAAMSAQGVAEQSKAENLLNQALGGLRVVVEAYPELKANTNFLALQEELSSTENKIGFARQFYNDQVMNLNNKVQMFPSNIVAGIFNFKLEEFFELEEPAEREAPKVQF